MTTQAKDPIVRVATITQDGIGRGEIDQTFERMERACYRETDVVCLPECFLGNDPVTYSSPEVERVRAWAKVKSCYIICAVTTAVDGRNHNSAIVIDRSGEVIGRYDKIHPTESELERGICPGDLDPPVFACDFGLIGIQICFDVNWDQRWQRLREKGAKIVFWPSAYPADRQLACHAWRNQYYVASATTTRDSRIYDVTGSVLSRSGFWAPWTEACLNLGKRLFETDFHMDKMHALQRKYEDRVSVEWTHDEDWFTLASNDPQVSVEDLIQEFDLLPVTEYHQRCELAQDKARGRLM